MPGSASDKRHFVNDIDYLITSVDTNRIENLSFRIDDIPFHVTHRKNNATGESTLCIQAILGYLPFSIQSRDKREAIFTIVGSTRALFHVRFGVDHVGRIFAAGAFTSDIVTSPDCVFLSAHAFHAGSAAFYWVDRAAFVISRYIELVSYKILYTHQ